jgi:hypothetical protein
MTDSFRTAKVARKRRAKFWREHIPLAYATAAASFAVVYFAVTVVFRRLPTWLAHLGASPSVVNLLVGTGCCGLGILGLRDKSNRSRYGTVWLLIFVLCLLSGILTLAKAFAFL